MPIDPSYLSIDSQNALILLSVLRDVFEGMSGTWMGKDYSGISDIMDFYEMENRRRVFELLQVGEKELGKFYAQKQKEQQQMSKAKRAR